MTGETRSSLRAGAITAARSLPALALYFAVVAWLSWPLVAHLGSQVPAVLPYFISDLELSAWAMAWSSRALVQLPWDLADANIYHPASDALFYGQTGLGAVPYFAPVFLATGNPVLAVNVTLLGGFAVTAWLIHLVVRNWTGSSLAGLVAGATLLSNRFLLGFVPTTPHKAALQCFPIIILLASRPHARMRDALLLVPFVVAQCLTDAAYVAPTVIAPLGILAVVRLLRPTTRQAGLRLATALVISLVLLAPVYASYARVAAANPRLYEQTVWRNAHALTQSPTSLVGQQLANSMAPITIVLVALGLARLAARRGRRGEGGAPTQAWAAGALWFVVGSLVTLGPKFSVAGHTVAMPMHYLGQLIPAVAALRTPQRMGYAALVGLSILAGLAFGELAAYLRRVTPHPGPGSAQAARSGAWLAALAAIVVTALYFDAGATNSPPANWPLRSPSLPPSLLVETLQAKPGPLLELPLEAGDRRLWPRKHATAMFHSILHRQPILNGYHSYYPAAFPGWMALAEQLPERDALAELRARTGLRWVWLSTTGMPEAKRSQWEETFEASPPSLRLEAAAGDAWLLEVVVDEASRGAPSKSDPESRTEATRRGSSSLHAARMLPTALPAGGEDVRAIAKEAAEER